MSTTVPDTPTTDAVANSIARVMTIANQRASQEGVNVEQSVISLTQEDEEGIHWRVNYCPKGAALRRGSDIYIDVNTATQSTQVLLGQ
jgi:hypothetical protein